MNCEALQEFNQICTEFLPWLSGRKQYKTVSEEEKTNAIFFFIKFCFRANRMINTFAMFPDCFIASCFVENSVFAIPL